MRTAVVLAGGLGERLGQLSKPLAPYRGQRLIDWVITRIAPSVDRVMLSVHRFNPLLDSALELRQIEESGERIGPLGGMLAARDALPNDDLLIVPCDAPALPLDLATRLASGRLSYAETATGAEPCCVWWAASKAAPNGRSGGPIGWLRANGATCVFFDDPVAFRSVNRPEDLRQ
jgi:molybdenum cofactor guanylyltransferase